MHKYKQPDHAMMDGDVVRRKHSGRRQTFTTLAGQRRRRSITNKAKVSDEKSGSGCRLVQPRGTRTRARIGNLKSPPNSSDRRRSEQNKSGRRKHCRISRTERPEFVSRVQGGKRGLRTRVGRSHFRSNLLRGVGRILQQIVLPVQFSVCDRIDLLRIEIIASQKRSTLLRSLSAARHHCAPTGQETVGGVKTRNP